MLIGRIDLAKLPLRIGYWRLPSPQVRLLTFVIGALRGNESPEVSELLLREALDSLRRGEADLGRVEFARVGCPLYRSALKLPGFLSRDLHPVVRPILTLELSKRHEEVLKGFSKSLRQELKQKPKRLRAEFGSVVLKCFERPEELGVMVRDVEHIAAKSYQRSIGVGFRDTDTSRKLLVFQATKGWLRTYVLYLGDRPSAFQVGCLHDGVYYEDDTAYDPEFADYSPGIVLQGEILEDLCGRHTRAIDFGPGDAEYKRRFGSTCHQHASLYLNPATLRGVAYNAVRTLTVTADETLKGAASRFGILPRIKRFFRGRGQKPSGTRDVAPT